MYSPHSAAAPLPRALSVFSPSRENQSLRMRQLAYMRTNETDAKAADGVCEMVATCFRFFAAGDDGDKAGRVRKRGIRAARWIFRCSQGVRALVASGSTNGSCMIGG
jgi:hypothetical protein